MLFRFLNVLNLINENYGNNFKNIFNSCLRKQRKVRALFMNKLKNIF